MRPLLLIAALLGAALPLSADPGLRKVSNLDWRLDAPWFGGFSGIEVHDGGQIATIIGDRGSLVRIRLIRRAGVMQDIALLHRRPLRNAGGAALRGPERDAEGLAIHRDGTASVSFEFRDHVSRLDLDSGVTRQLDTHEDFADFPHNRGLEALAVHPDGTLYALSENHADRSGTIPLYAYSHALGRWRVSHRIPLGGFHVPVGADFDAQGRLYVLERFLSPLGFTSRIRRLTLDPSPGRAEVLLTSAPGTYDNLEGISVWTDANGETRLTLISDDNFLRVMRSQIVEFIVTE